MNIQNRHGLQTSGDLFFLVISGIFFSGVFFFCCCFFVVVVVVGFLVGWLVGLGFGVFFTCLGVFYHI